ncbi:MAG: hypothetical protein O3C21_08310 [Verrucomicrobia bacterium]|nr:hypothetical protein [Verrucomicrobiota bacterium]
MGRGRGAFICNSDSEEAVSAWALNWNSIMDCDDRHRARRCGVASAWQAACEQKVSVA